MTMKILDLYKSILATAGLVTTSDGFIKMKIGDKTKPATVKGKSLVLPTPEHLKNPDWTNREQFHPLFENVLRPEHGVVALYRQAANIRVNIAVGVLATFLLRLATSPADHAKLSPDQSEFLSKVKHADERTVKDFQRLLDAAPVSQPQKSFVHIYLKKTGAVHGKRYSRVGVVTFPVYTELKKASKEHEVFGVKLRVKDRDTLIALMEFIFPGIEEGESYNRGSNSEVAPSIDVMMKTVGGLANPLNALLELFRPIMGEEEADDLIFNSDWAETFENLAVMLPQIRSIPMQSSSDGEVKAASAPAPTQAVTMAPAPAAPQFATAPTAHNPHPAQPAPWQAQPSNYQAPVAQPVQTKNGVDFEAALRQNPVLGMAAYQGAGAFATQPLAPPMMPMMPQQPMQYGGYPPPGYGQPMQQQYGGYPPPQGMMAGGMQPAMGGYPQQSVQMGGYGPQGAVYPQPMSGYPMPYQGGYGMRQGGF